MKKILLCFLFVLGACANTNISKTSTLEPDEGYVLLSSFCNGNSAISGLNFYKSGTPMSDSQPILGAKERKYKDEAGNTYCSKGKDLNLIKLKQGNYFIGALEASKAFTNGKVAMDVTYIPEQAAYKFTVKSRAVNYIGDPGFETKESGGNRNIHVSIARYDMKDNELIVRQKLNKNMPDLMKYPFVKSIAKK